jgi:hypothetical protein|tara:strand:+ start:914 stop:1021 length:108 start_codon:yes stop_codon:yes gene_type:complete
MNSHFKKFEKVKTGKTGVWVIKNKKLMENINKKQT